MSQAPETLPAPPVPADCDLRGFDFMPLFGAELFTSETWLLSSYEARCAALRLWWASWHQIPASSLPADDRLLSHLAGYGEAVRAWKKVKAEALRGFFPHSDGKLYHRFLSRLALEKFADRLDHAAEKAGERWRKNKTEANETAKHSAEIRAETVRARLENRPPSAPIPAEAPPNTTPVPPEATRKESEIPAENALKGREGKGRNNPPSGGNARTRAGPAAHPTPEPKSDPSPKARKATRLPADWEPPPEALAWARETLGITDPGWLAWHTDKFRDHWAGKPGRDGTRLDWAATWRNWIRTDFERERANGRNPNVDRQGDRRDTHRAALAQIGLGDDEPGP